MFFYFLPGEQVGLGCLAQGHFDVGFGTANLAVPGAPALLHAPPFLSCDAETEVVAFHKVL